MHYHGYLYIGRHGNLPRFDSYNRDPEGAGFPISPFPPNLLAHWLRKPAGFIKGTWDEPDEAIRWAVGHYEQAYSSAETRARFTGVSLEDRIEHEAEQLQMGNDLCWANHGIQGPEYREIYVICCPNAGGSAPCPIGRGDHRPEGATRLTGIP